MVEAYVLDSCYLATLFSHSNEYEKGNRVLQSFISKKCRLLVPELMWFEVNNILIKVPNITSKKIKEQRALVESLVKLDIIEVVPTTKELLDEAVRIAQMKTPSGAYISSYDATFHAVALLNDATFLTADKNHYVKTKDSIGHIVLLEDLEL